MITEAVEKTEVAENTEEEVGLQARGIEDMPSLHEHFERTTSELTPQEKEDFAIWMRVSADVLTKEAGGRAEQAEATIPAGLLEMLESAPAESIAMAYALIDMGCKSGEIIWNNVIEWLGEKVERLQRNDFEGLDLEGEQVPVCKWLAFGLGMGICEDE